MSLELSVKLVPYYQSNVLFNKTATFLPTYISLDLLQILLSARKNSQFLKSTQTSSSY